MTPALIISSYLAVSLAVSVVLTAMNEPELRALPRKAARRWAVVLALSAVVALLVIVSQDPWLLLGQPE